MFLDPNDPSLTGDATGDVNSPDADTMKQVLGLLQGHTSLAGAAGPNAFQMAPDHPLSGGASAPQNAFQMPAEAPPAPATSHIDDLMHSGLLTPTQGGQPVSPPPGGPGGPAAGPPTPKPPMVDRIHDWLQSKLAPSVPPGYAGLLQQAGVSPDEVNQAKPGLGSNLWHTLVSGGTGENMKNRLDQILATHKQGMELGGEQANMQEKARQRDALANMANVFPPQDPNATMDEQASRMRNMMEYAASHGLPDLAKEFGGMARALWAQPRAAGLNPEWEVKSGQMGTGDKAGQPVTLYLDKRTGKPVPTIGNGTGEVLDAKLPKDQMASALSANQLNTARGSIMKDFVGETKLYHQAIGNYGVVKSATENPSPTSFMAALTGWVHLISPTVRGVGMILPEAKKNIGGFSDKLQRYIDMGAKGTPEPNFLREIQQSSDDIMQQHATEYESTRQSYLTRAHAEGVLDEDMKKMLRPAMTIGGKATSPGASTVKPGTSVKELKAAAGVR